LSVTANSLTAKDAKDAKGRPKAVRHSGLDPESSAPLFWMPAFASMTGKKYRQAQYVLGGNVSDCREVQLSLAFPLRPSRPLRFKI
jgi:hypothetical protein